MPVADAIGLQTNLTMKIWRTAHDAVPKWMSLPSVIMNERRLLMMEKMLIDAYEVIDDIKAEAYDAEHDGNTEKLNGLTTALRIVAHKSGAIKGYYVKADKCYKRKTFVYAEPHAYTDMQGKNLTYKWDCPVCSALGNRHQVLPGQYNCPNCGVNLLFDEIKEPVEE